MGAFIFIILALAGVAYAIRTLLVPILVLMVSIGIVVFSFSYLEALRDSKIESRISLNTERCLTGTPILVSLFNRSNSTVVKSQVAVGGFEVGFSTPRATSGTIITDKIIKPLSGYEFCISLPVGVSLETAKTYRWGALKTDHWYD